MSFEYRRGAPAAAADAPDRTINFLRRILC
jgi:hypothetical protein